MWRTKDLHDTICGTAPAVPLLQYGDGTFRVALARDSFVPIREEDVMYYGGDQSWIRDGTGLWGAYVAKTGCGAVAAVNVGWYLSGGAELDRAGFLVQLRYVLRSLITPVLSAKALGRGVARFVRRISARRVKIRVVRNRSTGLREALDVVACSLARDRPVAMQVLRNGYGKAAGVERVIPWHWTVITALTFDPDEPEQAVCTYSTWGERRTVRFANAWLERRGLWKRASLVLFDG